LIDLILKDIADRYVRENFFRLKRFIDDQVFFEGNFKFFELEIKSQNLNYEFKHGLKFIPYDIIIVGVEGDHNFYFKYQDFTRDSIYISADGPVRLRFLAGKLTDKTDKQIQERYELVPPTSPSSPLPPAPATSAPRLIATFDTDVGTAVGDIVTVNGTNSVTKIGSNSSVVIPNGIFGVAYYKPTAITVEVIFIGIVGGYVGLSAGEPVFVSTAGLPTHTVPTTGMVQQIGFAVSTTEFFLQMMQPMRRD
jgi:hypothetical protein